uniref:Uncharacterized protein n=1 Tax=Rhizophora mucronata TaxID=61149 RepID=A0A2P2QE17_RHIMU
MKLVSMYMPGDNFLAICKCIASHCRFSRKWL